MVVGHSQLAIAMLQCMSPSGHVTSGACYLQCMLPLVHVTSSACYLWCMLPPVHVTSGACYLRCMLPLVHVTSGAWYLRCMLPPVHVTSGACYLWCMLPLVHGTSGACYLQCMLPLPPVHVQCCLFHSTTYSVYFCRNYIYLWNNLFFSLAFDTAQINYKKYGGSVIVTDTVVVVANPRRTCVRGYGSLSVCLSVCKSLEPRLSGCCCCCCCCCYYY